MNFNTDERTQLTGNMIFEVQTEGCPPGNVAQQDIIQTENQR